jgi:Zn-dependent protease with chaperone function
MDFFAHQEAARKRTKLLLFYYAVAVTLMVFATYTAVMFIFVGKQHVRRGRSNWEYQQSAAPVTIWNPEVFAGSAVITLTIIGLGTLWRVVQLRGGGSAVAEMLGGRRVEVNPSDPRERQLRNVIEEMAIASGTPVPEIFILENESAINAFAAGHSRQDMAVAVTRGTLEHLSRDELQGVIGHEFSHILNGDMRLNIRLMGVLNGILCLYIVGRVLLEMRSRSSRDRNPLPLFGLALMAIGGLGVFFAHLIQAAVSRQREFLADASAVQFTRNPNGIAGALKKIGGLSEGSKLETPQADSAGHFFFANGLSESWMNLTATHPPLDERIRRIDPSFDGKFPELPEIEESELEVAPQLAQVNLSRIAPAAERPMSAESVTKRVGVTTTLRYASGVIEALPDSLRAATHDAWSASAVLFATVLSADPEVRASQREMINRSFGPDFANAAEQFATTLAQCDRRTRLPLISLCLPALRTLSREQWQRVSTLLDQLITCDQQIDLFEFVAKRIVTRNIDAQFAPKAAAVVQFYSFGPLAADCVLLLSALANVGSSDANEIRAAFAQGFSQLPFSSAPAMAPRSACGVQAIDAALTRLSQAVPHIKKVVLQACAETVACDGLVTADEAELLRAVADSLGCPMPPFIEGV